MNARLSRMWERTRTVPGLGRDVAALVVLLVLGLTVAGVILAKQRVNWPWQDSFTFQADFRDTPAISPGNGQEVRIAGVTVGRIEAADVTDDGRARLTLALERGYDVYRDATLVLRPKTPLNDMYVEIDQGTVKAGRLEEGEVLPVSRTASPVQVDEVVGHLDDRTRAAMTALLGEADVALAHAPDDLARGLDQAASTLETLRPVVESLRERRATIASLVSAVRNISEAAGSDDERLARLVSSLDTTLGTLSRSDGDVRATLQRLPGVTDSLSSATRSVERLSHQLDPTLRNVGHASTDLPAALRALRAVAGDLEDTANRAAPAVAELRPLSADLRPVVRDLRPSLVDLRTVTGRLDSSTRMIVANLTNLQAFVYNTASVVSMSDANGGILRGQIAVNASTLPIVTGSKR